MKRFVSYRILPNRRRTVAAILLVCIVALFVLAGVFVVEHADHFCTGDHCPVCAQIYDCVTIMSGIGVALAVCLCARVRMDRTQLQLLAYTFRACFSGSVQNKTRLNL